MVGRHRQARRSAAASARLVVAATVVTGAVAGVAASQGRVGAAPGRVSVAAAGLASPASNAVTAAAAAPWSPERMEAATPPATEQDPTKPAAATAPSPAADTSAAPTTAAAPAPAPTPAPQTSASTAAVPAPAAVAASPAPPRQQNATSYSGTAAVGILFFTDKSAADHYCTASVVDSPGGDLVISAGHCVYSAGSGPKTGMAFVPGYHDGQSPYGQWNVSQVVVADAWRNSGDPDADVGFLVMDKPGSGATLESVTGANGIGFATGFGQRVTVPAYPQGASSPVICANPTSRFSATQTEFDCGGYPDGTSGAPFLVGADGSGAHGTVVGVIGGYEQGGDTPSVSYSAYFGPTIQALYQTAVSH